MKVEIDSKDVERLEKNLSKLGDEAESTVNNVLHDFGVSTVKKRCHSSFTCISQK